MVSRTSTRSARPDNVCSSCLSLARGADESIVWRCPRKASPRGRGNTWRSSTPIPASTAVPRPRPTCSAISSSARLPCTRWSSRWSASATFAASQASRAASRCSSPPKTCPFSVTPNRSNPLCRGTRAESARAEWGEAPYPELGYRVVVLPKTSVKERADAVLAELSGDPRQEFERLLERDHLLLGGGAGPDGASRGSPRTLTNGARAGIASCPRHVATSLHLRR